MITKFENFGTIYNGHVLEIAKQLPNESVDCVITSPPYWQLRDYGQPEQWGLEPTYQEYLAHLQSLMKEIWRVLKPHGTVWVNLGDTYTQKQTRLRGGKNTNIKKHLFIDIKNNLQPKSLILIPHRFAIDCIDNGWIVRNDIIWAKPNAMPESVTDRFSKKHEYMFFMVKNQKYHFDLDSVREEAVSKNYVNEKRSYQNGLKNNYQKNRGGIHKLGKNCGSVSDFWQINTVPSRKKHYATFNNKLIIKPILAGCPQNGVIYDPFMGSGTTAIAALEYGRKFIGSELNENYYQDSIKAIKEALQKNNFN